MPAEVAGSESPLVDENDPGVRCCGFRQSFDEWDNRPLVVRDQGLLVSVCDSEDCVISYSEVHSGPPIPDGRDAQPGTRQPQGIRDIGRDVLIEQKMKCHAA